MNKYIFVTTEGSTYQPDSASPEPDIENMQVLGFGQGDTAKDALRQLLDMNQCLLTTSFDEIISIQLLDDHREFFYLSDVKQYGIAR